MSSTELCNRIGIELDENEYQLVSCHSSIETLSRSFKNLMASRAALGRSILNLAYAIYLYDEKGITDKGEISQLVASIGRDVSEKLFEKYGLGDFVAAGYSVKPNQKLDDISFKLVGSIYRTRGFLKTYEFLRGLLIEPPHMLDTSYKKIVQNYAQSNKLAFEYVITKQSGPSHAPVFECELRTGRDTIPGIGKTKKLAESEAAKTFVLSHGITPSEKSSKKRDQGNPYPITKNRIRGLESAAKLLSIPQGALTAKQFNICLTHISFEAENPGNTSNDTLKLLGAYAFDVICLDFLEEQRNPEQVEFVRERTLILKEECLAKAIPQDVLGALWLGRSVKNKAEKAFDPMKVGIAKAILASIWLNLFKSKDASYEKAARQFAYSLLEKASGETTPNYRSLVQEIVQRHGYSFHDDSTQQSNPKSKGSFYFISTITIPGDGWQAKGTGKGSTKRKARNRAIRYALPELFDHCPDDEQLLELREKMEPELRFLSSLKERSKTDAKASSEADRNRASILTVQSPNQHDTVKEVGAEKQLGNISKAVAAQPKIEHKESHEQKPLDIKPKTSGLDQVPSTVSFDGPSHTLYVCKGTASCTRRGHRVESATGLLFDLKAQHVRINVNYCHQCHMFFIGYREYSNYRNRYGAVLGNISFSGFSRGSDFSTLADESPLMMCGYTVSQAEDLTAEERRLILANIMDRGILNKAQIIDYLNFFISRSKTRKSMKLACEKWSSDLQWVRSYKIDRQRTFAIESFKRYR